MFTAKVHINEYIILNNVNNVNLYARLKFVCWAINVQGKHQYMALALVISSQAYKFKSGI